MRVYQIAVPCGREDEPPGEGRHHLEEFKAFQELREDPFSLRPWSEIADNADIQGETDIQPVSVILLECPY